MGERVADSERVGLNEGVREDEAPTDRVLVGVGTAEGVVAPVPDLVRVPLSVPDLVGDTVPEGVRVPEGDTEPLLVTVPLTEGVAAGVGVGVPVPVPVLLPERVPVMEEEAVAPMEGVAEQEAWAARPGVVQQPPVHSVGATEAGGQK